MTTKIVVLTEEYVRNEMNNLDGSHDFYHIQRVKSLALKIASAEGGVDLEIVQLAALLHDIDDWKYRDSATTGLSKTNDWLSAQHYGSIKMDKVLKIIELIGFENELDSGSVA